MTWLSRQEIEDRLGQVPAADLLFRAYALSLFTDDAFYASDFEPDEEWKDVVPLSMAGEQFLSEACNSGIDFPAPLGHFTLFRIFYHHDLLVDYEKIDLSRLTRLIQQAHQSGKGRWLYVFGNTLYHKFNDTYDGNRTDSLDAELSELLVAGTSQGVFQVGNILSGPLGLIESLEDRTVPPTLRLPLWHCSDTGCQTRHLVRIQQHKNRCAACLKAYIRFALDRFGPAAEWAGPLLWNGRDRAARWPTGRPYYDLPAVIGDCMIGTEREALCRRALRSAHNPRLAAILNETKSIRDRPEKVASILVPEEQHQLLLVLPDRDLIDLIDELIHGRDIKIPPSELRRPKTYAYGRSNDTKSELSSLGLRSTGHPPIIELAASIWQTYKRLGATDDLAWRVRGHGGTSVRHSVMDFIRVHGPETAVRELILPSREVTTSLGEALNLRIHPGEEECEACRRFLWKFGFTLARYEDEYTILRNRIAEFRERVLQIPLQPDEHECARVRSVGVNLFVSVEQFLENLLCYNVWLLSSDHFTGTKFLYTKQDAVVAVSRLLGPEIESGVQVLRWSKAGENTLGVLLAYLQAFCNWLKNRPSADRSPVERSKRDYPHYAADELWIFPFEHTALWADIPAEVLAAYAGTFDKICAQVAQAEFPAVRNGLDHKREEGGFPDADKMLACVSRLQQIVDTADSRRLVPKLFWGVKSESDTNGNVCDSFADYKNMTVSLFSPSPVLSSPGTSFGVPYIIAPYDFLNQPNSTLVFRVSPRTEYREYWKNYPRRRVIPQGGSPAGVSGARDDPEGRESGTDNACIGNING
jgi:hypothetical protein